MLRLQHSVCHGYAEERMPFPCGIVPYQSNAKQANQRYASAMIKLFHTAQRINDEVDTRHNAC